MNAADEIFELLKEKGNVAVGGETVSPVQHALQTAALAEKDRVGDELIVAALLHDIGHLLPRDAQRPNAPHEETGHAWLAARFGPAVAEPVRLHVAAKRYLCAVVPGYDKRLSRASAQSLKAQGGPMNRGEADEFKASPHRDAAIRLRRWDDEAKVVGLRVPALEHHRPRLEKLLAAKAAPAS